MKAIFGSATTLLVSAGVIQEDSLLAGDKDETEKNCVACCNCEEQTGTDEELVEEETETAEEKADAKV